jgi:nitric oxide reductase NorQ protein
MPRPKSEEALYIESKLQQNADLRYLDLVRLPDYNLNIEHNFFNTVKSRFKKASVQASIGTKVVVSEGTEYDYSDEIQSLIPAPDPYFVNTPDNLGVADMVQTLSKTGNLNIRLVGPAGCGKTSFALEYAARHSLPALAMDCANVREPRDWFGYRQFDVLNKNIVWHESLFVRMVETPYAVIVLDELNRVSPLIINTLIPLLDYRRCTYLEEAQRQIVCAEGVTFWASINEGHQFTGTIPLDEAIADRFAMVVECKFLPAAEESIMLHKKTGLDEPTCVKLVEIANQVRTKAQMDGGDSFSKPISTRMLENAAKAFKVSGAKTLKYTLANHFSSAGGNVSERQNLIQLLVGKFGSITGVA